MLKSGPMEYSITVKRTLEKNEASRVTPPTSSWMIDLDNAAPIGAQEKNDPTRLVMPCRRKQRYNICMLLKRT